MFASPAFCNPFKIIQKKKEKKKDLHNWSQGIQCKIFNAILYNMQISLNYATITEIGCLCANWTRDLRSENPSVRKYLTFPHQTSWACFYQSSRNKHKWRGKKWDCITLCTNIDQIIHRSHYATLLSCSRWLILFCLLVARAWRARCGKARV